MKRGTEIVPESGQPIMELKELRLELPSRRLLRILATDTETGFMKALYAFKARPWRWHHDRAFQVQEQAFLYRNFDYHLCFFPSAPACA